jgi:hypothetical protein
VQRRVVVDELHVAGLQHHVETQVVAVDEPVHALERGGLELAVAGVRQLAGGLDRVAQYPAAHHAVLDAVDRNAAW